MSRRWSIWHRPQSTKNNRFTAPRSPRARLRLEPLEDRTVPTVLSLYWSETTNWGAPGTGGTVHTADPNGANEVTILSGYNRIDDVELDLLNGDVYWNNWASGAPNNLTEGIFRADLNGANVVQVTNVTQSSSVSGAASGMHGIFLDPVNGVIYFTRGVSYADFGGRGSEVSQVNFDGTGYSKLNTDNTSWFTSGIAVNLSTNTIYFGSPGVLNTPTGGAVNSVMTNGTNQINNLVPHTDGRGRAMALDVSRGLLFYSSWNINQPTAGGGIWVYNLNNLSVTQILNDPTTGIPDVELDTDAMQIYWTDFVRGEIRTASYNSVGTLSGQATAVSGLTNPFGLALEVVAGVDFDDAAASYGVASHSVSGIQLGANRDFEAAGFDTALANGDDLDQAPDDEDGVVSLSTMTPGGTARLVVNVQNAGGFLDAWVDWDNSGTFTAGEQINGASIAVGIGNNNIDFNVPTTAVVGNHVIRLRVSSAGGLAPASLGTADGEVEDHIVTVVACPNVVYVHPSFTTPGMMVDGDLVLGGVQPAEVGYTAFATITQAVTVVCPGGIVFLNPFNAMTAHTYVENVVINKSLTLDGTSPDKTLAIIDPVAGNAINVTASNVTIRDLRTTGAVDGIFASGVANFTLNNVLSDLNSDDGFDGDNLASTLNIINGCYNDNGSNGMELDGVAGVTVANVNGPEARRNTGHGLIAVEMLQLSLVGGLYLNNSGSGVEVAVVSTASINGTIASSNGIDGVNIGPSVGSSTHTNVTAQSNLADGLNADSLGGTITITGGNYSFNRLDGIELVTKAMGGAVSNVTASNNGLNGFRANQLSTNITFTNGIYNGNLGVDGIQLSQVQDVTANNVNANGNRRHGLLVTSAGAVSASGGSYSSNVVDGVNVSPAGATTLTNVTANTNGDDGADIDDVPSATITGGSYSQNGGHGIELFGGGNDLNRTARVTSAAIINNTNAGIFVDGDTDPDDCGGDTTISIGFLASGAAAGNRIEDNAVGIDVWGGCVIAMFNDIGDFGVNSPTPGNGIGARLSTLDGFLQLECNQIHGNGTGVANAAGGGSTVQALLNWWGGGAPNTAGNDTTVGSVDFAPWAINPDCTGTPPPVLTNEGDLLAVGTAGADSVTVTVVGANVEVKINNLPKVVFLLTDITGHLIVYGFAGNDSITVSGKLPSEIHGGAGRDVITGGERKDIIWGDDGDDFLQGELGNDVLIGGRGRDRLSAGSGMDILLGGEFCKGNRHNGVEAYDYDVLCRISQTYVQTGVCDGDLAGGLADDLEDTEADRLTGGQNNPNIPGGGPIGDWFLGNFAGAGVLDFIADFLAPDKQTEL